MSEPKSTEGAGVLGTFSRPSCKELPLCRELLCTLTVLLPPLVIVAVAVPPTVLVVVGLGW